MATPNGPKVTPACSGLARAGAAQGCLPSMLWMQPQAPLEPFGLIRLDVETALLIRSSFLAWLPSCSETSKA